MGNHGNGGCCGGGESAQESSQASTGGGCCSSGGCSTGKTASEPVVAIAAATFEATDEKPILFTDSAIAAVKNAIAQDGKPGDGLRVSVRGGGCSGYQYELDFDQEERMGDITVDAGGVTIYIDAISAGYLKGTTVDYLSGLQGTGFKFNNPNAKRTCGCGSSFS